MVRCMHEAQRLRPQCLCRSVRVGLLFPEKDPSDLGNFLRRLWFPAQVQIQEAHWVWVGIAISLFCRQNRRMMFEEGSYSCLTPGLVGLVAACWRAAVVWALAGNAGASSGGGFPPRKPNLVTFPRTAENQPEGPEPCIVPTTISPATSFQTRIAWQKVAMQFRCLMRSRISLLS